MWSFDGSSTQQAEGNSSDCLLNQYHISDPDRSNGYLVMTEVLNADGTHIQPTPELLLMMTITIFGLVLSRSIF